MGCQGVRGVAVVQGGPMRLKNCSSIKSRGGLLSLLFMMGGAEGGKGKSYIIPFGVHFLVTTEY